MSGGFRVSIPSGVRRTIQNIKEITGNHSDDEVYAMLKECGMDPNETTQRLLLQDTFHEVKRKRDKRKDVNHNNRELADSRWRPGMLGRGGRGGRGGYSSRYISNDAIGGRNPNFGKEIRVNQGTDKGNTSSSSDMENKFPLSTSSSVIGDGNEPSKAYHATLNQGRAVLVSVSGSTTSTEAVLEIETPKPASSLSISGLVKSVSASGPPIPSSEQLALMTKTSISGVFASSPNPVPVSSLNPHMVGAASAVKCEARSRSEVGDSTTSEAKQLSDTSQAVPQCSLASSSLTRSSAYSSRPQQLAGLQKAGPSKEWKPKSAPVSVAQNLGVLTSSESAPVPGEAPSASISGVSDVTTLKIEGTLENLQLSETHVIIPSHLQVPESERHGLSFGSFDASFKLNTGYENDSACRDTSPPPSESSHEIEENVESSSSILNDSPASREEDSLDHPDALTQTREPDISNGNSPVPELGQSIAEGSSAPEDSQSSVVPTAPTYSTFGLVPQMVGSQYTPFESAESQARDATRLPSVVVQQSFDPSSYYTQIYRPSDGDGRFSPYLAPGASGKYNGNIVGLPGQNGQTPQESANPLILSSAGPTAYANQAAGVLQSSVALTQQPVPVFRQPAGVHVSHFPPNYVPYNQYFPPFYVPSPAFHHYLSNTAFPQQPTTGSIYPPSVSAATAVKYPISQYKPGTNSGNSNHVGVSAYGTYNSTQAAYNTSSAVSGVNSIANEDLSVAQYKENNVYITGQQSEGSTVWIPAAARDVSGLAVNSFYNHSPQGQHMTFTPTQAGHGGLAGVYQPTPAVAAPAVHPLLQQSQTMAGAVEVIGPAGVYQQPQHAQINWTNNY